MERWSQSRFDGGKESWVFFFFFFFFASQLLLLLYFFASLRFITLLKANRFSSFEIPTLLVFSKQSSWFVYESLRFSDGCVARGYSDTLQRIDQIQIRYSECNWFRFRFDLCGRAFCITERRVAFRGNLLDSVKKFSIVFSKVTREVAEQWVKRSGINYLKINRKRWRKILVLHMTRTTSMRNTIWMEAPEMASMVGRWRRCPEMKAKVSSVYFLQFQHYNSFLLANF